MEAAINTALILLTDEISFNESTENTEYLAWLAQTRQQIEEGLAQSKRGESLDGKAVMARLREKVKLAS